jgi:hypothetical protein
VSPRSKVFQSRPFKPEALISFTDIILESPTDWNEVPIIDMPFVRSIFWYPTTLSDVTSAALAASVYLRGKDTLVASRPKGVCLQAALALIVYVEKN